MLRQNADRPTLPVLLYDERCGVCRRFVSMLVGADRRGLIRIAPLQGPRGDQVRRNHPGFAAKDSALWLPPRGNPVGHSDAILAALEYLGGGWRLAARAARFIPRTVRDWAYRTFAEHRSGFGRIGLAQLDERSRQRLLPDDSPGYQ